MANFLIYHSTTGVIDRTGSVPDGDEILQPLENESVLVDYDVSIDPAINIVVPGNPPTIVLKPSMSVSTNKTFIKADGVDSVTVSNIPVGTQSYINDAYQNQVDDGEVIFKSQEIGPVVLRLINDFYRPLELLISVGCVIGTLIENTETVMPSGIVGMLDLSSELVFLPDRYRSTTGSQLVEDEVLFSPSASLAQQVYAPIVENELVFISSFGIRIDDKDYIAIMSDMVFEIEQPL